MKIITLDNKSFDVKYMQSKESITFNMGSSAFDYPDFVGSKLYHNSSSSNKYSLTFAMHRTVVQSFIASAKIILTNSDDAVKNETYGELTDLILEHKLFGAIKGKILGDVKINTGSESDVTCTCLFQENTADEPLIKKDLQDENTNAVNAIDTETTANFDVDLSEQDKSLISKFGDNLNSIYSNIQNSAVIEAFNDFNAEINAVITDSQRVMNSVKKILSLPNNILTDISSTANRLELLKAQAEAIKAIPINTYNIALFNVNSFSYNMGMTSKTAFVSESALAAAAGLKTVPLT